MQVAGEGLVALKRQIKALNSDLRKEINRELNRALREGASSLIPKVAEAARRELPSSGGLAARVAAKRASVSLASGRVRIMVKGMDARSAERGRLRHPVYGNREVWVTQQIKPGWFTDEMRREAPKIRPRLVQAIETAAQRVVNG